MRRAVSFVLAAASAFGMAAFGMTGCGGSPARPNGPVEASYATMLDRAFRADWQQLSARKTFPFPTFDVTAPDPRLLPKVGAFLAANAPVRTDIETRLRGLRPPVHGRATWTQLKVYAIEANTLALRQIHTAEAGDTRGFSATVQLLGNLHDTLAAQLAAAGLPASNALSEILLA
ncbi:MAG: hypothetical protein QOD07_2421 [Frankiaceae bacterium]|nr:hypothetical protein [Frankiaceae bacterium]